MRPRSSGPTSTRRPAIRRDAGGLTSIAPTWESLTERLIREALKRGDFDGLPSYGRTLVLDDDPREGDMGLAFHLLRNARVPPPWIAADMAVRSALDERDRLLTEACNASRTSIPGPVARMRLRDRLERIMADHDDAVARLNAAAPSLSLHRRRLDQGAERARLDAALSARPGAAASVRPGAAASGRPMAAGVPDHPAKRS